MEPVTKKLLKNKRLLVFKKDLYYGLKFIQIALALLNCANLFFAGLITSLIIRWINSFFGYTIPKTVPDWFAFYVIILYIIILAALLIPCSLLIEKLEDFEKYDSSFDINYLRSRIKAIKQEIADKMQLERYNNKNPISAIDNTTEKPFVPEHANLLEHQNINSLNSLTDLLNENQPPQNKHDNTQDLDYKEPAIEIVDTIHKSPVVKNLSESLPQNTRNSADNGQSNGKKNSEETVYSLNPISHLEKQIKKITEDETQNTVSQELDEDAPINVIDSLNEIFVSKENMENISEENEIAEVNYILPKLSAEDYVDRNKAKQEIGLKGEYFILKYEKSELTKNNRADLAIKVRHISKDEGDYVGYDIFSYDENGNEKCIEVKTSVKGYTADFFLTENEMDKIKKLDNYFIYRVFDFDTQTEKGNLYIVNCKKDFGDYFTIQPTQYKISPRKK